MKSDKEGYFIIGDSVINKKYSGTSVTFDSLNKSSCLGLTIVILAWTNEEVAIPVSYELWYSKEVTKDLYASKLEISLPPPLKHKRVIAGGLYRSKGMIDFLNKQSIGFVMRIATNRVVTYSGHTAQLKNNPSLRLQKNEHSRTLPAQ